LPANQEIHPLFQVSREKFRKALESLLVLSWILPESSLGSGKVPNLSESRIWAPSHHQHSQLENITARKQWFSAWAQEERDPGL